MNLSAAPEHVPDVNELSALRKYLQQFSSYDQDTGFPNCETLLAEINTETTKASPLLLGATLIEIRIRGLSRIGEAYSRKAIGSVIRQLADRLALAPLTKRTIARIDHKSFGVFLPDVADPVLALQTAKQLVALCSRPVPWGDHMLNINAIAGVAMTTPAVQDANTLLHHAGLALRASSENGSPGYAFFDPTEARAAKRRSDLVSIVAKAVEQDQFEMVYQPFFAFDSGKLVGFEALMRLRHPEFGQISPSEFIPIAEDNGLISRLGAWCMEDVCRTAVEWPSHLIAAVNFSPAQFYSGTLLAEVNQALERTKFPAYRLDIEITEGTFMRDQELVLSQLNSLRDMGCSIALDDFGTGYSSLGYLWQFPFSKLKIDRSFIHALDTTPKAPSILKSIIDLSRNLGIEMTAEGIETTEQMRTLRSLNCDYLQGFLCGVPTAKSNLAAIILKNFSETLNQENAKLPKIRVIR
ncbi:MAG: EAL domain-containing protein [Hyphomicrobiales bacterium]|nr:EAL domain-containing protein [Hyphomicrobiales bacterium]